MAIYLFAAFFVCIVLFVLWRGASGRLARQTGNNYVRCTATLCSGAGQIGALMRGAAGQDGLPDLTFSVRLAEEIAACRQAIARFPADLGADARVVDAYFETVYQTVAHPCLLGETAALPPSSHLLACTARADDIAQEMETLSVYYLRKIKKPAADLTYRSAAVEAFGRLARRLSPASDSAADPAAGIPRESSVLSGGMSVHEARTQAGDIIGSVAAYLTGTGTVGHPLSAFCFYCGNYYVTVDRFSGRLLSLAAAFGPASGDIGQSAAVQRALSFIEERTACAFAPVGTILRDGVLYLRAAPADGGDCEILVGVRMADGRVCLYDARAYEQCLSEPFKG